MTGDMVAALAAATADTATLTAAIAALAAANSTDVTIGTANGLSLAGQVLSLAPAGAGSAGAVSAVAQTLAGVKTLQDGLVVGQQAVLGTGGAALGTGFANPTVRIPITGSTQLNLLQFGGNDTGAPTSTQWELAFGFYTGAGAPTISSRAGPLLLNLASGTSVSPLSPNTVDLGSSGNYWRNLYLSGFNVQTNLTANQVASVSKVLHFYAAGTSGVTETLRLASQRADSGLKCVVVGTESSSPVATAALFQISQGITGAASDAGNGTARASFSTGGQVTGFKLTGGAVSHAGFLAINDSSGTSIGWNTVTVALDSNNIVASAAGGSVWNRSNAADGAAAVAAYSHSSVGWANATARLHVFRNGATEVSQIMANGEYENTVAGGGLVLKSPNGTRYRLTVANGGTLSIAAI